MVVENEQQYQFHQFVGSESLPTYDDRSLNLEPLPLNDEEGGSLLVTTGVIAALSGLGLFIASNLELGFQGGMTKLLIATGIIGVGIGIGKVLLKLMKPRGITLPSIKLKHKSESRNTIAAKASAMMFGSFREKQSGFRKSITDKVFTGVCGGIAESSGISSSILRAIFIAAFAMTAGTATFIYIALSVLMRDGGETSIQKISKK
jgi:phage shock protein PspC (stress-responsive transcriptional regulator)